MCGILGSINLPFGESVLSLLEHRGPDDSGLSTVAVGSHNVTIGQRRLSILDLSPAGHQPMWTPSRQAAIVFNGEIYNHLELRNLALRYRGHSDTETILYYLAQHGPAAARDLNGIFALALLDVAAQKLYLVRDPFGVKPLYYRASAESVSFSSELLPLRRLSGAELDTENLAELLRLRYLPAPDTLYKDIRKVKPGHIVQVDLSRPELSCAEYAFASRQPSRRALPSVEEVREEYGFLVKQAVRRQLLSDVEVGVLLSGGVDSALISVLAQRETGRRMKAFTVGFDEHTDTDEIADAAQTAAIIGMDHEAVRLGRNEFFDLLPAIAAIVEEPIATTSAVPMYRLASLAGERVKVVLSGQGADEAMGGYRRYQGELLRSLLPAPALSLLRTCARWTGVKNDAILRGLGSMGERDDVSRFESVYGLFATQDIHRLIGRTSDLPSRRIRYFFDLLGCRSQDHSVERMMTVDLRMNLADDLLLYTDKVTMRHSLECRVPLLDLNLVRWVEALPYHYRVRFLRGKILHKQLAREVLPSAVVNRRKKGFQSPTDRWFRESQTAAELLLSRNSRFSTFFDLHEVRRILEQHATGLNRERHIFLLLSLYYWMEQCLDAGPNTAAGPIAA